MRIQVLSDVNQCTALKSDSQIADYALKKIDQYGFEYFHFRLIPRFGNALTNSKVITNYPNELIKRNEVNNLAFKNPIISHCQASISPIIWEEELFHESSILWEDKQTFGLRHGCSQAVHDASGATGILSLARSEPHLSEEEFHEKAADVLWLCNRLHASMCAKYLPQLIKQGPLNRLSVRESEVLKWTAEGKTASDIGMILNLTTRTVNFHISSAIRKMGANNKTSAVVIATKSGLL